MEFLKLFFKIFFLILIFKFSFSSAKSRRTLDLCSVCGLPLINNPLNQNITFYAPWTINLEWSLRFLKYCSGVIIDYKYAITAAHCFEEIKHLSPKKIASFLEITAGTTNRLKNQIYLKAEEVYLNENFFYLKGNVNSYDDIAIIKFKKPIQISSKLRPICLGIDAEDNDSTIVQGFGNKGPNLKRVVNLKQGYLKIISDKSCKETYQTHFTEDHLCAKNGTTSICPGDSGGPLIKNFKKRNYVVGLSSWGGHCDGFPFKPIVFTKVFNYLNWIQNFTKTPLCLFNEH